MGRRRRRTVFQCEDDGEGEIRAWLQSVECEVADGVGDSEVWTRSDLVEWHGQCEDD